MPVTRGSGGLSSADNRLVDRVGFSDESTIYDLTVQTRLLLKRLTEDYGIIISHADTSSNNQHYTITLPAVTADDTFMMLNTAQTFNNKTFNNPIFTSDIFDANDNELLGFTSTASAVNELTIANNSTGNPPSITATGNDTNIDITLAPKGSGVVNIQGNINVTGTSTTVNSTTLDVDDKNITMAVSYTHLTLPTIYSV